MIDAEPADLSPEGASRYLIDSALPDLFGRSCVQCTQACGGDGTKDSWPAKLSRFASLSPDRTFNPRINPHTAEIIGAFSNKMIQHHPYRLTPELAKQFAHQCLLGVPELINPGGAKGCSVCEGQAWSYSGRITTMVTLGSHFDTVHGGPSGFPQYHDIIWRGDVQTELAQFNELIRVRHAAHGGSYPSRVLHLKHEEES